MRSTLLLFLFAITFSLSAQSTGDVIITEFLPDPAGVDDNNEFIELFNTTTAPIDMSGWVISDDGSDEHIIGTLTIPARSFVVLCRASEASTEIACDYVYGSDITLANGGDEINITSPAPGSVTTHSVQYSDGDDFGDGISLELVSEDDAVTNGNSVGPDGGSDFTASTIARAGPGVLNASPGAAGNTALPVELASLVAQSMPKSTMLKWSTASESGNDYFAVERSFDGAYFSEIGRVRGSGNTAVSTAYLFEDERPLEGTNYYRLRQVDLDGTTAFSRIVSVERVFSGVTIFPNPTGEVLYLRGADRSSAVIIDMNGRELKRANQLNDGIDVSTLRAGTYLLRVTTATGTENLRFVRR